MKILENVVDGFATAYATFRELPFRSRVVLAVLLSVLVLGAVWWIATHLELVEGTFAVVMGLIWFGMAANKVVYGKPPMFGIGAQLIGAVLILGGSGILWMHTQDAQAVSKCAETLTRNFRVPTELAKSLATPVGAAISVLIGLGLSACGESACAIASLVRDGGGRSR